MRRKDREITDIRDIEKIIAGARYLHLGMFDGDFPYVVPMHYGYELKAGKIIFYMHCAKEGHKLDCIKKNNNVFIEIDMGEAIITADIPCKYGAAYESVMCRGKAEIIDDKEEKVQALELLMKTQTGENHKIDVAMSEQVSVIRVDVLSYTGKARLQ